MCASPYRKYYDAAQAAAYQRDREGPASDHRRECGLVRRALDGLGPGARLLDIPCGAGRMSLFLAGLGFDVHAADVSPAMVERARLRLSTMGRAVPVEIQDLEGTTYPDRSFDAVFCFRFFHHLPDDDLRARVARELRRISGGRLLVSYQDSRSVASARRHLQSLLGRPKGRFPLSPRAMREHFEQDGFRLVRDHARLPWFRSLRLLVLERSDYRPRRR